MKCPSCQAEIPDGSKFCQQCGNAVASTQNENGPVVIDSSAPQPAQPAEVPAPEVPVQVIEPAGSGQSSYAGGPEAEFTNGSVSSTGAPDSDKTDSRAIASLVCGIVGLFLFTLVLGIIAVVLGVNSRKVAVPGSTGYKLATAGIVVGTVDLAFCVLAVFAGCSLGIVSGLAGGL